MADIDAQRIKELVDGMKSGSVRALSRLMTIVETNPETMPDIMRYVYMGRNKARRIGLAGPPGAGKSTLLSNLILAGVKKGLRVGVLCIDPTSPVSGGAILGDRIRMSDAFSLKNVFIRSVASGRSLGGLAESTKYHTLLFEAFGMDLILIETVGLGQVGYDIRSIAETLLLVMVPESGDTVQILKSGILELADIMIVNKADRDGADEIAQTLIHAFDHPRDGWSIPVIKTMAREGGGIKEVWDAIENHLEYLKGNDMLGRYHDPRNDLREAVEFYFQRRLQGGLIDSIPEAAEIAVEVGEGKADPYSASARIVKILFKGDPHEGRAEKQGRVRGPTQ